MSIVETNNNISSLRGKIKSVTVKDFVTCDFMKMKPGLNLNIIIGPNGTGKSTMVAAILIGLGGNCKLLSRSSDLCDYIKNGKTKAEITIEIYTGNHEQLMIFYRSFDNTKQMQWLVNNLSITQKEYINKVKQFNIQIDNLCQFLPQDRVQDFAKMNPQEILLNTQKSVCPPATSEQFVQLIEMKNRLNKFGMDLGDVTSELSELERRNEAIKTQIDSMEARNTLVKSLSVCHMKKAWMEFEALYEECNSLKNDLKKANTMLTKHNKEMEPLRAQKEASLETRKSYEAIINNETKAGSKYWDEMKNIEVSFEQMEDKINKSKSKLQNVIQSAAEYENELKVAEKVLIVFQKDLAINEQNIGDVDKIKDEIKEKKEQCDNLLNLKNALTVKRDRLNSAIESQFQPEIVAIRRRIEQLENIPELKLKLVSRKFPDTFRGIMWLRDNHGSFSGRVYEPPLVVCNLKHPKYAKYFENAVNVQDLTAFMCETNDDASNLMNILRERLNLKLTNIGCNSETTVYQPNIPLSKIQRFGFEVYLIDVIEGPPPILNQLCKLHNIHNIPVGNDNTYNMAENVPPEISVFFSTNHKFRVTISRYTNEKSTAITEINEKNLLDITVDGTELEAIKKRLAVQIRESDTIKNKRNELESKCSDIVTQYDTARREISEKEQSFSIIAQVREKIRLQQKKISNLKLRPVDVAKERLIFKEFAIKSTKQMLKLQTDHLDMLDKYYNSCLIRDKEKAKYTLFKRTNSQIDEVIKVLTEKINESKKIVTNIEISLEHKKNNCQRKQQEAKELTNGHTPSGKTEFPFKNEFDQLPKSIDDLLNHIDELQSRIECMSNEDIDMEQYKLRQQKIEDLKKRLNSNTTNKAKLEFEMNAMHDLWYPTILDVVREINRKFSNFMHLMSYAGEIELVNNDISDYQSYGINIRVKYRNQEKMQTLDRHVQSGGERAVAIAIYTLSLQHLTNVPFRCVDEIDQGMDRRNGVKIYELLVSETGSAETAQYFFITPKPLSSLACNDLMKVHIVHNGVGMISQLDPEKNA